MTGPAKQKGDRAERELASLLSDLLGYTVRRKLGAGRQDDQGDLEGLPDTTIQCTANTNATASLRTKPLECEVQQERAGSTFGFTAVRLHGGGFRFVLTESQLATLWREAQPL